MTFGIYNKLGKPLYIDWKKSSYIDNTVKLDYWIDEEKSSSLSESYYYFGPILRPSFAVNSSVSISNTTKVKVERITFIPPKSNYYKSDFYILPINFFELNTTTEFEEVSRNDKPKKETKVYYTSFTKENSPLIFRNFLTFSLSEDFESEFYVDNEFYIQNILEMEEKHFEQFSYDEEKESFKRDENGDIIMESDFKDPSLFYLRIPKTGSIKYRK